MSDLDRALDRERAELRPDPGTTLKPDSRRKGTVTAATAGDPHCEVDGLPALNTTGQDLSPGETVWLAVNQGRRFVAGRTVIAAPRMYHADDDLVGSVSAQTVIITLSVPAQPVATVQHVAGHWTGNTDAAGSSAQWTFLIRDTNTAGFARAGDRQRYVAETSGATRFHFAIPAATPREVPASTSVTYVATIERTDGAGTIANGFRGHLTAFVVPA